MRQLAPRAAPWGPVQHSRRLPAHSAASGAACKQPGSRAAGLALGRCLCSSPLGPRPPQGCSAAVYGCVAVQRGLRAGCRGRRWVAVGGWQRQRRHACKCSPRRAPQASGSLTAHIRVVCCTFHALRGAQGQFGRPVQAPVPGRSWPSLAPVPAGTARNGPRKRACFPTEGSCTAVCASVDACQRVQACALRTTAHV